MLATPIAAKRTAWPARPTGSPASDGDVSGPRPNCAERRYRQPAGGQPPAEPGDAAQVGQSRGGDVDPAVGVIDKIEGHDLRQLTQMTRREWPGRFRDLTADDTLIRHRNSQLRVVLRGQILSTGRSAAS